MTDPILDRWYENYAPVDRQRRLVTDTSLVCSALKTTCIASSPCRLLACPSCLHEQYLRLYNAIRSAPKKPMYMRWTEEIPTHLEFPECIVQRFNQGPRRAGLGCLGWITVPGLHAIDTRMTCSSLSDTPTMAFIGVWSGKVITRQELATMRALKKPNRVRGRAPDVPVMFVDCSDRLDAATLLSEIFTTVGSDVPSVVQHVVDYPEDYETLVKYRMSF